MDVRTWSDIFWWKILEIREIEDKGYAWTEWRPVRTSKKYVMAQINLSLTGKPIRVWVNLAVFQTEDPTALSGLEGDFYGLGEINILNLV